jgi:beta-glucanase (GH16 family)
VFRQRVRAAGIAGLLAVVLSACGSAAEPELTAAPDSSQGAMLAPTTTAPPPTSSAAPAPAPTSTATPKPSTTKKAAPNGARRAAAATSGVAWVPAGGDEFGGGSLDKGTWGAYDSEGAFGNGRRSPDAVSVVDGALTITARPGDGGVSGGVAYSQGQLYGRWEFRARTEKGRGWGSAILLWPDSEKWPDDGELDMMEVPGENRDLAHTIIHYGGSANKTFGDATKGDFSQWHTFVFEWLPDRLTAYIDGKKTFETTDKAMIPTAPMHATVQLDQGPAKDWMAAPDETTPAETKLQVDYMRVSKLPGQAA